MIKVKKCIWSFRKLRGLVVIDSADTVTRDADTAMTTRTLLENFVGFSQILTKQSGKFFCKIWKYGGYLGIKIRVHIVVDYVDTRFSHF